MKNLLRQILATSIPVTSILATKKMKNMLRQNLLLTTYYLLLQDYE
jgi:hypothetical protein